jgi:ParB family chromosome partitioning protein
MAAKKGGLGKGLDSLISDKRPLRETAVSQKTEEKKQAEEKKAEGEPFMVPLKEIEPNQSQPRKDFDEESLQELADSIRKFGVLQPLLVEKKDQYYEIIAGERRWRAAKLAKVEEVPVIVKKLSDQERMEISLIENIQRENLNPIEEANAYKTLLDEFGLKQEEVAERVSKSRSAVTNSMRLLKLDPRVQALLKEGKISAGHARALLSVENADEQYALAEEIVEKQLSVRDIENKLKKPKEKPAAQEPDTGRELVFRQTEDKLKEIFGTKVEIQNKRSGKGKISISYYSMDELERILELLERK